MDIKIATLNAEWMVSIFNGDWNQWDGTIKNSFAGKHLGSIELEPIDNIPQLCRKIASLIKGTKAQIIGIQEGPPLLEQMNLFIKKYLGDEYVAYKSNSRWQSLFFLVKKPLHKKITQIDHTNEEMELWWKNDIYFQRWESVDLEYREEHEFYRIPLIIDFKLPNYDKIRFINVHTKSKFSKLKTRAQWENRERQAVLDAILSRQKLSTEIFRMREYVESILKTNKDEAIVILGDFNDGPFAQEMEREFLIHNIIDELVGTIKSPDSILKHVLNENVIFSAYSTMFTDPFNNNEIASVLIDHILLSPRLWKHESNVSFKPNSGKVELELYENLYEDNINSSNKKRHLRPSDHIPVSAVIEYT